MIHVTDEVYRDLADRIKNGDEGYWQSGNFSAWISCEVDWKTEYTGVEFMGDKESYLVPVVLSWEIEDFRYYDDDDNEIPTDFDPAKIKI